MLSQIVDFVILASALAMAITNLYNFFAKPTAKFKQRRLKQEKEQIQEVLDEELPEILLKRDLETRDKYKSDRQRYLEEIKQEILLSLSKTINNLDDAIKDIREINKEQNEKIETLAKSSRDVLREKIMAIYHKGRHTKILSMYDKESLNQYYIDYKSEEGNSYIDKYYKRMQTWTVMDDEDECID